MKKTVLITGASRGIGAASAIYFAKMGYDVAINFIKDEISAKKVLDKVEALGRKGLMLKADVSNQVAVTKMVADATRYFGKIDVLVNNAGIAKQALFTDVTEEEWNCLFSVNVGGMFHAISAILPQMIHRKEGAIVNVSSIWGICGASCEVHYSASKAAIIGATKALAQELAPSNIRVNCIAPGVIDTEMNHNLSPEDLKNLEQEIPIGRLGTPEDIAKAIYFLADNQWSSFITGQILSPNGGYIV